MTRDNLAFTGGLGAIATGCGFIYWPLALVIPGTIVCVLVILAWLIRSRTPPAGE